LQFCSQGFAVLPQQGPSLPAFSCEISVGCSALCSGFARAPYCQVGDVWRQSGSGNGAGALVTPQKMVVVTMDA